MVHGAASILRLLEIFEENDPHARAFLGSVRHPWRLHALNFERAGEQPIRTTSTSRLRTAKNPLEYRNLNKVKINSR
jgi:hypothetical protein